MRRLSGLIALALFAATLAAQTRIDASAHIYIPVANDGTTGTTANQLAKVNSSGNAVKIGTGDTSVPVYIVIGGAGTTGNAQFAVAGPETCKFDAGGGTAGHFVVASTTTAATCHDAGATAPTSGWTIGVLTTSPAANANGTVLLVQGYLPSSGGGSFTGGTLTSELILAASATGAASANLPIGTLPTTPSAGDWARDSTGFVFFDDVSGSVNGQVSGLSTNAIGTCPSSQWSISANSNLPELCANGGSWSGMWYFVGSSTLGANASTISLTSSPAYKHYSCRLLIAGYSGSGVARAEFGNISTVDTGANYSFGGFNIASGTSTAPTVSGIGSGSTAQEGVPVSGSTTTAGRFVQLQISNTGTRVKYFTLETSGVNTAATSTPNLAHIGGFWSNTTDGIGVIQFKACTATTGTCTTTNLLSGTSLTCWGRNDN